MDEYRVEVAEVGAQDVALRLRRRSREATLPLGSSFAYMLLTDESAPGYARGVRARDEEALRNEDFWLKDHVVAVAIEAVYPPQPDTEDQDGDTGSALVRITLNRGGLLGHLEVGQAWGTAAYDENGDCLHFEFDAPAESPTRWVR